MFKKLLNNNSFMFSFIVLAMTWIFTIVIFQANEQQAVKNVSLIMFFPLIVMIIFSRIRKLKLNNKGKFFGASKKESLKGILFGFLLPIIIVLIVAGFDILFQVSTVQSDVLYDQQKFLALFSLFIPALLSAFGEEAGWRGYLLPSLMEKYSKLKSSIVTGIVWAMFHMPAIYFLAKAFHMVHPIIVVLVQGGTVFMISFGFSYIYIKTKSLLSVILLHGVWNLFNPYVLGDIYQNQLGILKGDIFIQNGEGVMGLVVLTIFAFIFGMLIKKINEK